MYSVLDVTEDVVDPFSQSFSPFLLLERLGDRKPSADSGLEHIHTHMYMHRVLDHISAHENSTNYTVGRGKPTRYYDINAISEN